MQCPTCQKLRHSGFCEPVWNCLLCEGLFTEWDDPGEQICPTCYAEVVQMERDRAEAKAEAQSDEEQNGDHR